MPKGSHIRAGLFMVIKTTVVTNPAAKTAVRIVVR